MGVPKFYRWVSERYPCLSETVKEFQIPEFDNLYLDMNGIIHVCSHPEDDNPHFRITEEKIFADIMHYLEFLFRMIKPRKVFFMAVDGVAPRAKMNQQRGRRFRSAREAEELERKAKEKGETLPSEKRFDSNCITPGTPFMVRLQEQLKYFVVKKLSTDPLWHGVRVYLSGHETPGEGEHKIMDFIRAERSRPGYDPNTRHCLNGLDADLMMLGLASHEPHFSLLREEVRFGGRRDRGKRPATPEETTFHLLHLSLFREYLDFEFSALKDKVMTFEYDLENIIDDWVLMGFLVGNDFIPHLPNLHINHDALPLLWQTYIDVLPSCGGYLNEGGHLNLERFEKYLAKLSEFDMTTFSEQAGDLKWLEGKKAASGAEQQEMLAAARKFKKNMKKMENQFAALNNLSDDLEDFMGAGTELIDTSPEDISEEFPMSDEDSEDTLDDEFRHHKRHYYMSKLEYDKVTPEVLKDQAECYVRGIQWILLYYYQGVPSWSWFYPHHYAPYMSDVKDFKNMVMEFDLASPFLPFEQLMAVLPAASREFLPKAFQSLMTMDNSPVIDFYPLDFETDLNGKQQDWEAVVLIPFIDENRLLSAMRLAENQMTEEEKSRNRHGPHCLYEYSPEPGPVYQSIIPEVFPDIVLNHSRLTLVPKNAFWIPPSQLKQGILEGAKLDVFFPGFPTLKHIQHTSRLSKEGVKVFQQSSRGYNVMLHISEQEEPEIDNVAKEYLGKEIYVGWPHLYEARVVAVCDAETSYTLVEATPMKGAKSSQQAIKPQQIKREACDENVASTWCREASSIKERYKDRLGVVIGDTYVLLKALPMTGRKYIFGSHGRVTMEKQFGNRPVPFALQTTVKDIAVHDPDFCQFKTLKEYLPESSSVFMLGWPHYGCQGEVIEVDTESGRVRINLMIFEEPNLDKIMNNQQMHDERYFPGYRVAQMLGVSSSFIGRLTGTVFVMAGEEEVAREQQNPHKVNVGLNLKFTKRGEEIPGYTKNVEGQWMYSQKTIDTFKDYMAKFPEMFEIISKLCEGRRNDNYYESEVIPKYCDYNLKSVQEYIKGLHCSGIKPMKSGTDIISEGVIKAMETETNRVVEINKKRQKRVKMQVKPHLLFRHLSTSAALIPDSTTRYTLFDRIVNIRHGYAVPFGLRGTVVGIHPAEVEVNTMYEVIFDEDFCGGIAIRGSSNRGYRMPPSAVLNLTHGERKNGVKPPLTAQTENQASNFQGNQHRNMGGHPSSQNNRGGYQNFSQGRGGYSREADSNQVWERNQSEWDRQNRNPGNENRYRPPHQRDGNSRVAERQNESSDSKKPQQQIRDGYSRMVRQQNDGSGGNNTSQPRVEPKEDVLGKVFNGASAGSSHPKFVTPKVPENLPTARRQSQGESQSGGATGPDQASVQTSETVFHETNETSQSTSASQIVENPILNSGNVSSGGLRPNDSLPSNGLITSVNKPHGNISYSSGQPTNQMYGYVDSNIGQLTDLMYGNASHSDHAMDQAYVVIQANAGHTVDQSLGSITTNNQQFGMPISSQAMNQGYMGLPNSGQAMNQGYMRIQNMGQAMNQGSLNMQNSSQTMNQGYMRLQKPDQAMNHIFSGIPNSGQAMNQGYIGVPNPGQAVNHSYRGIPNSGQAMNQGNIGVPNPGQAVNHSYRGMPNSGQAMNQGYIGVPNLGQAVNRGYRGMPNSGPAMNQGYTGVPTSGQAFNHNYMFPGLPYSLDQTSNQCSRTVPSNSGQVIYQNYEGVPYYGQQLHQSVGSMNRGQPNVDSQHTSNYRHQDRRQHQYEGYRGNTQYSGYGQTNRCQKCAFTNHSTEQCHYPYPVQCSLCNAFGHKDSTGLCWSMS